VAGSSEQCLAPGVWEVFLTSIGCPLGHTEDGAESGSPSKKKPELGSPKKGSPMKTQMHLLTYAQVILLNTLTTIYILVTSDV